MRSEPSSRFEGPAVPRAPKRVIVDLAAVRLARGAHTARGAGMGVMEAVAWLANEPHANHHASASPVIATFCRLVNDRVGDQERQRLVSYVPRLVGTNAAHDVERRRTMITADWAVRTVAVAALGIAGLPGEMADLRQLPPLTDASAARAAARAAATVHERMLRAAEEAGRVARKAARATWTASTPERSKDADLARGASIVLEAVRVSVAEAAQAAASAEAAWSASARAEAVAPMVAWAAVGAWAAAVHAAVQVPTGPVDWTVPLERMLAVS